MRTKTGIVVSTKMEKTAVIQVETKKRHLKYKKLVRKFSKFYAHDPEKKCQDGDTVTIYETRPLSRLKRWTIVPPPPKSL